MRLSAASIVVYLSSMVSFSLGAYLLLPPPPIAAAIMSIVTLAPRPEWGLLLGSGLGVRRWE